MKNLYFISLYNFAGNEYARILITVDKTESAKHAEEIALIANGSNWRISSSRFVCITEDDVCMYV